MHHPLYWLPRIDPAFFPSGTSGIAAHLSRDWSKARRRKIKKWSAY
jgi:hypothetical protein